jgi:hypothetical protein
MIFIYIILFIILLFYFIYYYYNRYEKFSISKICIPKILPITTIINTNQNNISSIQIQPLIPALQYYSPIEIKHN